MGRVCYKKMNRKIKRNGNQGWRIKNIKKIINKKKTKIHGLMIENRNNKFLRAIKFVDIFIVKIIRMFINLQFFLSLQKV